jgi:hypothetical protein
MWLAVRIGSTSHGPSPDPPAKLSRPAARAVAVSATRSSARVVGNSRRRRLSDLQEPRFHVGHLVEGAGSATWTIEESFTSSKAS